MPKPTPDDTPTRILNATLDLIAEKGSDALRTRQILERAGVSNLSAVSYYFGSLDNLRLQALERYFAGALPVFAGLDPAEGPPPDPRQALREYCRRMAGFILEHPALERNMVFLAISGEPASTIFTRVLGPTLRLLQGLIARGRPEPDPSKALFAAIALASATIYPLLLAAYGPGAVGIDPADPAQREQYFNHLVDMVLGEGKESL